MTKTYTTAAAFRQALERHLQQFAKENNDDLERTRRKVAFERFLARLFAAKPHPWVLKGGYALEVRFETARATKDLDLSTHLAIAGSAEEQHGILLDRLQECADIQLGDFFTFRVKPTRGVIKSAPYGGFRFPVDSLIAGRRFVSFSVDIGIGDAVTPPVQTVQGTDWLTFCGLSPALYEVISFEQQYAEKMHALFYSGGERENSRVKDLVDVVMLIQAGLDKETVRECVSNTFQRRDGAPPPQQVPNVPESWEAPFNQMAEECEIEANYAKAVDTMAKHWITSNAVAEMTG